MPESTALHRAVASVAGRSVDYREDDSREVQRRMMDGVSRLAPRGLVGPVEAVAPARTRDSFLNIHGAAIRKHMEQFFGVGRWYENFEPTSDDEVRELLSRAEQLYLAQRVTARASSAEQLVTNRIS